MRTSPGAGCTVCAVCALCGIASADLGSGRDKLIAGDYKGAITDLSAVTGKDKPAARLLLVRAQTETGDFAAAEAPMRGPTSSSC